MRALVLTSLNAFITIILQSGWPLDGQPSEGWREGDQ